MRTTFLFLLISAICFTSFISKNIEGKDKLDWMLGSWESIGYQIDGKTWKIELNFPDLNSKPTIKYPSLRCGGIWELQKVTSKKATFIEKIEEGTDKCDQGCEITVTEVNETHLSVAYFLKSYSENVIAYSVLVKQ